MGCKLKRYGPSDADFPQYPSNQPSDDQAKQGFRSLLEEAMEIDNPDHIPRLLANNIELVLSLQGTEGVKIVEEVLEEAKSLGPERVELAMATAEMVFDFVEGFVEEANNMDNHHKDLLGKIIKTMRTSSTEEDFDKLMNNEKASFTPGFLRHLEGECTRISNAPKMSPESARLLEIIRIIQTRVLEELGKDMGQATLALGQLMGYEDEEELLGVLDAGLTVQGRGFGLEMAALTKEALEGFRHVAGGVDPGLVDRVRLIDNRLREYLEDTDRFQ